jgi:hypothetical protein
MSFGGYRREQEDHAWSSAVLVKLRKRKRLPSLGGPKGVNNVDVCPGRDTKSEIDLLCSSVPGCQGCQQVRPPVLRVLSESDSYRAVGVDF